MLAAELAALLFVPPAAAAPPAPTVRELHALASAVDLRVFDSLASVRVVQTVRNDAAAPLDLAPRLPTADARIERLRVARGGCAVELVSPDSDDCGAVESSPHDGHAQTTPDELRADLLTLPAGDQATIDIVATGVVDRDASSTRIGLPATSAPLPAQAWLLTSGATPQLVVVPPPGVRGTATLTVRPARGATQVVTLGSLTTSMIMVPLTTSASADQLAHGAIELEVIEAGRVTWTTLPFVRSTAVASAVHVR
jgi:hypothetical protein